MTRKEAIERLTDFEELCGCVEEDNEAVQMAIKTLEQEPCEDCIKIEIPNNATNEDVFKAVFGYAPATDAVVCNKMDWCGASESCNYCTSNPDSIGREEEWWNAPYKEESEDKK